MREPVNGERILKKKKTVGKSLVIGDVKAAFARIIGLNVISILTNAHMTWEALDQMKIWNTTV